MMRRVTMLGIAALILLHPVPARAGLFGGGSSPDDADVDRGANRSYERAPREDASPRSPHGMRVREVGRRASPSGDEDAVPTRTSARDSSRGSRDDDSDADLPRSSRRRQESSQEDGLERENGGFDKKMQDLNRQLAEAEQAENPRKIKAIKWMIDKEEQRHDSALGSAARQPPVRTSARKTGPSYEPPDREDRSDDRSDGYRSSGERERAADRISDRDEPRRPASRSRDSDEAPSRFASRSRTPDPEVSNPLKERSKRRGEESDGRSRSRSDRDEDEQDSAGGRDREASSPYSNAARIARAEGGIRRY